jgi:hypothetical protein
MVLGGLTYMAVFLYLGIPTGWLYYLTSPGRINRTRICSSRRSQKSISSLQLSDLSSAQEVSVKILQEHETGLTVSERYIALINTSVVRMGKKIASLSDNLSTDKLIMQLGYIHLIVSSKTRLGS